MCGTKKASTPFYPKASDSVNAFSMPYPFRYFPRQGIAAFPCETHPP